MIEGGITRVRLLEPDLLVKGRGRTLARSFVPREELGKLTGGDKALLWADRLVSRKWRPGKLARKIVGDRELGLLRSQVVDPRLKLELVKAGAAAKAKTFWRRLARAFRSAKIHF